MIISPTLMKNSQIIAFSAKFGAYLSGIKKQPKNNSLIWKQCYEIGMQHIQDLQILPCHIENYTQINQIEVLCFTEPFRYSFDDYKELFLDNEVSSLAVWYHQEMWAYIFWNKNYNEIITLNVHPTYRRLGLGSLLMILFEDTIKCPTTIGLFVSVQNDGAIQFYKTLQYKIVEEIADYYAEGLNAYVMEKEFNQ